MLPTSWELLTWGYEHESGQSYTTYRRAISEQLPFSATLNSYANFIGSYLERTVCSGKV